MNSERRKAALTLAGTLVIGILLGLLVPGLFFKMRDRDHRGMRGGDRYREPVHKKEWFTETIYHIIQPDSNQVKQIKPVTEWASRQIDSLEVRSNHGLEMVLDSVKKQLKPVITDEQFKRLEEFDNKAKGHWRGRGGRH